MDDSGELRRARERLHKIEASLFAVVWRLELIEERLKVMGPKVDAMARADEIAAAVNDRLGRDRRIRFTRWQRLGGYVVVLATIADAVSHFL